MVSSFPPGVSGYFHHADVFPSIKSRCGRALSLNPFRAPNRTGALATIGDKLRDQLIEHRDPLHMSLPMALASLDEIITI